MSNFPTLQFVAIEPNLNPNVDYLIMQSNQCILGYGGGIRKFINERVEVNPRMQMNPMELKKFNLRSMYRDHLLARAPVFLKAWSEFLDQETITIGVTNAEFKEVYESVIEEVLPKIARLVGKYETA